MALLEQKAKMAKAVAFLKLRAHFEISRLKEENSKLKVQVATMKQPPLPKRQRPETEIRNLDL
jgi:hypothetical protein